MSKRTERKPLSTMTPGERRVEIAASAVRVGMTALMLASSVVALRRVLRAETT